MKTIFFFSLILIFWINHLPAQDFQDNRTKPNFADSVKVTKSLQVLEDIIADSGYVRALTIGNQLSGAAATMEFAAVYDSAAPEYYQLANDSLDIMAALTAVDRVEFSQSYDAFNKLDLTSLSDKELYFSGDGNLNNVDTVTLASDGTTVIINPGNKQIFKSTVVFQNASQSIAQPEWLGVTSSNDLGARVQKLVSAFSRININAAAYSLQTAIEFQPNSDIRISKKTYINIDIPSSIAAGQHLNLFEFSYEPFYLEGGIIQFDEDSTYTNVYAISIQIQTNSDSSRWKSKIKDVMIHGANNSSPTANGIRYFLTNPATAGPYNYFDVCDNIYITMVDTGIYLMGSSVAAHSDNNAIHFSDLTVDRAKKNIVIDRNSQGHLFTGLDLQPHADYTQHLIVTNGSFSKFYGYFWDLVAVTGDGNAVADSAIWIKANAQYNYFGGLSTRDVYEFDYIQNDAEDVTQNKTNSFSSFNYFKSNDFSEIYIDTTKFLTLGTDSIGRWGLTKRQLNVNGNIGTTGVVYCDDLNTTDDVIVGDDINFVNAECRFYRVGDILQAEAETHFGVRINSTQYAFFSTGALYPYTTKTYDLGQTSTLFDRLYVVNPIIGDGTADTDWDIDFNGETNDGYIRYMEDEDRFDFDASINIGTFLHLTPGSAPGSPAEGDIYANSTDHHLYFYNGTGWVQLDN